MYERRRKVPMLDVAERLVQAAGADLGMVTRVVWEVGFLPGLKAFWYPDRLWRVEVPGCFDTVVMPDLVGHTGQEEWDLRDQHRRRDVADRAGLEDLERVGVGSVRRLS